MEFGSGAARERLHRGLRGDVGRKPRRVGQHADRRHVDDVALPARGHRGQQVHRQAHAREVIELHRALEVVEPVVRQCQRAADRAPGVVDQHVDVAEFLQDVLRDLVVRLVIRNVAGIRLREAAGIGDPLADLGELLLVARDDHHPPAGLRHAHCRGLADARGAPRDHHDLALDRALKAAIDREVGIEVAFPVVPQPPGVVLERRHADLRLLEQPLRRGRVEAGRVVDELQHRARHLQVAQHLVEDVLHRLAALDRLRDAFGNHREDFRIDPERHFRRVRRAREHVEHFPHAPCLRVGQVEALAVLLRQVRQVHQRLDHEIDGHGIDVPALDADQGHPARPGFAQPLQCLEEIVRPVDLVDDAGLRVAEHDARTVDAEGHLAVGPRDRLGVVLGAVVRMVELLGLLEHVLAERAAVQPGRRDRAHVVKAPRANGIGHREGAFGADDVGLVHFLGRGIEVVDRAEVVEVLDLALEPREIGLRQAEPGLAEVALDRHHPPDAFLAPEGSQVVQLADGSRSNEHVDGAFAALQQGLDEKTADEAGRASHEVGHGALPFFAGYVRGRR